MTIAAFDSNAFDRFILENEVIGFFDQPLTLKSGKKSYWYVNWRKPTSDVFLMDRLTDFILSFINEKGWSPKCIFGVPEGATKTGIISSFKWAKNSSGYSRGTHPLSMGRAKAKTHGDPLDRNFVGSPVGPTVVIEDVTTTGDSLYRCLDELLENKVEVIAALSITTRSPEVAASFKQRYGAQLDFAYMSNALSVLPKALSAKKNLAENVRQAIERELSTVYT